MQVVLEDGKAVGVKVVPTKPLAPGQMHSRVIKARKQIIVSGGTLSSPLILQRSGIGDPEKLRKAGVKPLVDLPGVGLNFQVRAQTEPHPWSALMLTSLGPLPYLQCLPCKAPCRILRRLRSRRPEGPRASLQPVEHQRHRPARYQWHRSRGEDQAYGRRAQEDG